MRTLWNGGTRRLRKNVIGAWACAGVLTAIAGLVVAWHGGSSATGQATPKIRPPVASASASPSAHVAPPGSGTASQKPSQFPQTTLVATVKDTSPRFVEPGVRTLGQVPGTWWGVQSVLPVVAVRQGWVKVRLAQRPNGSEAWVPASDVSLSSTHYLIVLNLKTTRLALYYRGRRVFSAPAGVGTPSDPTPTGHFFVAFTEPPPEPNPGYGPFIVVTSAHSPEISDWAGSGDAVIGIHGPLGDDSLIGTTGARISHGCIRLHVSALLKLQNVPPGTPINIIG
jgi:lipoprotein-anchoring transpeptidase ErfK/SrfK